MTFLASFIQYLVIMIVLAAIGILGGILVKSSETARMPRMQLLHRLREISR